MTRPIIILGAGYTGRHLVRALTAASRPFFATSRDPDQNLSHVPACTRIEFGLERPSTWPNIPIDADLIWCFPATPAPAVQRWVEMERSRFNRLVVLGSTAAYKVGRSPEYPPSWIDETAPIDLDQPRVEGEETLRNNCGALVLRVAGIYGPGRNPLDWIRRGRIGPSRKYVNLIHVEDLAAICLAALERAKPGEAYNVSDGQPHTWNEICDTARQRWGVTSSAGQQDSSPGKRISNAKLRAELGYALKHSNLYEALSLMESVNGVEAQDNPKGSQQGPRREGTGGIPTGMH
jgi:nucleoside-diphosphate-sugar epimerase